MKSKAKPSHRKILEGSVPSGNHPLHLNLDLQQLAFLFPHYLLLNRKKEIVLADAGLMEIIGEDLPLAFEDCFRMAGPDPENQKVILELLPAGLGQHFEGSFLDAGQGQTLFAGRRLAASLRINYQEQKYSHVLANLNLGILEVDMEDRILFANQSFCQMSGYEENEILGKSARLALLDRKGKRLMNSKSRLRETGIADAYELQIQDKDGNDRFWLVSGAPTYDEKGRQTGSIGIHLDITDQKVLESELIKAREEAETSARVKEDFLVNMSHEIRTPMHVITGMAELLSKTSLVSKQQFYLSNIRHAADTMLALMNDILDLSKMEAGKLSLEQIPFEISGVLKRMLQLMQQSAEEKGLDLQLNFSSEGISPLLLGDPHRLNQILYNLLSNAIKFTSAGKIVVDCRLEKEVGEEQVLFFQVQDTGSGMEKSFLGRLFEKFSQEHGPSSRASGGTGLGMNICKELIDLMGGKIEVKSQKNKGTTVSFRIPFLKARPEKVSAPQLDNAGREILAGLRVLLVDDNEMNRLVASTILSNLGTVVKEAENGLLAVDSFLKEQPDLVLMDIRMPIMDGMEASKEIRRFSGGGVPIVALTAHAMKSEIDRFYAAGMNAYLPKPFTEAQLISVVVSCLKGEESVQVAEEIAEFQEQNDALWNLEKLRLIARGNEEFIQKMVRIFWEQTPIRLKELEDALAQQNWKSVSDVSHKMKPSLDSMGIESVSEIVRNLEKAADFGAAENLEKGRILTRTLREVLLGLEKEFGLKKD